MRKREAIEVNGRRYASPDRPLVVVCVDGSEGNYITEAADAGLMPYYSSALRMQGTEMTAEGVLPTFTNPNNLSIVTGAPPSVHGICGNYFLDPETGEEVMMNDPRFLRAETILAAFAKAGAKVAVVTAKDKLRRLLGHGMELAPGRGVCFSAEKAASASLAENGIENLLELTGLPQPDVYSAALSEFVFAAGVKLMERERPDIMYLSTTDYVQHKHAPGTPEANAFYGMMDGYWAKLAALGATLAITADHGMNAKHDEAGRPNVIYLQDILDEMIGKGRARVVLPITDPYVVHHGALGGFAMAYLPPDVDVAEIALRLDKLEGITFALPRDALCARYDLPPDRVGDLGVHACQTHVIGISPAHHDLSGLKEPLRSHGSLYERYVPFLINRKLAHPEKQRPRLRSFDIFEIALNELAADAAAAAQ